LPKEICPLLPTSFSAAGWAAATMTGLSDRSAGRLKLSTLAGP
jgi:hypothetical protein